MTERIVSRGRSLTGTSPCRTSSPNWRPLDVGRWTLARIVAKGNLGTSLNVEASNVLAISRRGRLATGVLPPKHELGIVSLGRSVNVWPLDGGDRFATLQLTRLGFNRAATHLITTEEVEKRIKVWDLASGTVEADRVVSGNQGAHSLRFTFAPDGRHLAVAEGERCRQSAAASAFGMIHQLHPAGLAPRSYGSGLTGITSIALAPNEDRVRIGGENGHLRLVSVADGMHTLIPTAHRDAVRSVAFGPGGRIATGSADRTIKLWDADGRLILTLRANGGVRKLAVSTDGQLLTVLVDGELAVRRWRLGLLRTELTTLCLW